MGDIMETFERMAGGLPKKSVLIVMVLLFTLTGCGLSGGKHHDEDVSLRIVKSGMKIEDMGYDPDLKNFGRVVGREIYKFTIPVEISGTFKHDTTIPIYYYFDGEHNINEIQKAVSNFAYDGGLTPYFKGEIKIKEGTTGIIHFEGMTDGELLSQNADSYDHAWAAIEYDDGFVPDNYAGIVNPFYDASKDIFHAEENYKKRRIIEPQTVEGNVMIDESSIKIEKSYVGEEPGNPQHYTVSVTIRNDTDNPVSTDDLRIACDYDLESPVYTHDCMDSLASSMWFTKGFYLDSTVIQKSITQEEDSITVAFDMYNRYVTENKTKLGSDLDWFFCFWISICLDDDNPNDNYVIVPNPFYDGSHLEDLQRDTSIYDDYTWGGAWNVYWREKRNADANSYRGG